MTKKTSKVPADATIPAGAAVTAFSPEHREIAVMNAMEEHEAKIKEELAKPSELKAVAGVYCVMRENDDNRQVMCGFNGGCRDVSVMIGSIGAQALQSDTTAKPASLVASTGTMITTIAEAYAGLPADKQVPGVADILFNMSSRIAATLIAYSATNGEPMPGAEEVLAELREGADAGPDAGNSNAH